MEGAPAPHQYTDSGALTAGAGSIDVNDLTDDLGDAVNFAQLHLIYIANTEDADPISMGGTNTIDILDGDTDLIVINAGGFFVVTPYFFADRNISVRSRHWRFFMDNAM